MGLAEPPLSLNDLSYEQGTLRYELHRSTEPESVLSDYLKYARYIFEQGPGEGDSSEPLDLSEDFEHLRWFPLPNDPA
jgi:hypothetical protein